MQDPKNNGPIRSQSPFYYADTFSIMHIAHIV